MIAKILRFVTTDVWRIRLDRLPRTKSFFVKQLRVVLLAARGFDEDKCHLRASALTFYSLLSTVPVIALAFGVAKGFGFEKRLEKHLLEQFTGQEEVLMQALTFSKSLLEHTKGGVVAGIGLVALLWAVIKVLGQIENSFNEIWGVTDQRSIGKKFSDYLSMMFIAPLFLIVSSSLVVFVTTQVADITQRIAIIGAIGPLIFMLLKLLPYCVIWALFTFLYMFMPNTKVHFRSGLLAGIVAGTIYQLAQWGYITFQVGVAKYNAIYGSFAALPLFLIWLQLSWIIVLFGAEISFADQNVETYEFEPESLKISPWFRKVLTLEVTHTVVMAFAKGENPPTATEISRTKEIPVRLVRQILHDLIYARIVSETSSEQYKDVAYLPAVDINILTVGYVTEALEKTGVDDIPVAETKEFAAISETLQKLRATAAQSGSNKLLRDI